MTQIAKSPPEIIKTVQNFENILRSYQNYEEIHFYTKNKHFWQFLHTKLSTKENFTAIKIIYEISKRENVSDAVRGFVYSGTSSPYTFISLYWLHKLDLIDEELYDNCLRKYQKLPNFNRLEENVGMKYVTLQYKNTRISEVPSFRGISSPGILSSRLDPKDVCFLIDLNDLLQEVHCEENLFFLEKIKDSLFEGSIYDEGSDLSKNYSFISRVRHNLAEIKYTGLKLHINDPAVIKRSNNAKRIVNYLRHHNVEFYLVSTSLGIKDMIVYIYFYMFHIDFNVVADIKYISTEKILYYFGSGEIEATRHLGIEQVETVLRNLIK